MIANEQFARVGVALGILHSVDRVWRRLHMYISLLRTRYDQG
jgi:hypothetical protein